MSTELYEQHIMSENNHAKKYVLLFCIGIDATILLRASGHFNQLDLTFTSVIESLPGFS